MEANEREWETSLDFAAWAGQAESVRRLRAAGSDPNEMLNGVTPLIPALNEVQRFMHKDCVEIVKLLQESKASVSTPDQSGWTPLHYGCQSDSCVGFLLDSGADPNAPAYDGTTPLHVAARHSSVRAASILLLHSSSTASLTDAGESAVDAADAESEGLPSDHNAQELLRLM